MAGARKRGGGGGGGGGRWHSATHCYPQCYIDVRVLASRPYSSTHEGSPVALNRLNGPHSQSGRFGEQKINCACRESNRDSSIVQFLACNR